MSVKKSQKHKDSVKKGVQGSEKKHKIKPMLPTQSTPMEKIKKNPALNIKSNIVLKTVVSGDSPIDKHSKLKERKQLKRKKALERKNKKLRNSNSGGDTKDAKTTLIKNKSSKIGKTEKTVSEKVNEKSTKLDKHQVVTDIERSKDIDISQRKKGKCIQWKKQQMAEKRERKKKTSKDGKKDKLKEKIHIAKTAEEATANWTRLQQTLSESTEISKSGKRKIPLERLRNPKLRKREEGSEEDVEKDAQTKEPEIWFDDVDEILLDRKPPAELPDTSVDTSESTEGPKKNNPLVKPGAFKGVTKIVCMDCEMVGVGDGTDNMLARVSVVNQYGEPIYDKFVKPKEEIIDYRTHVSGVRPRDLEDAEVFEQVQKDVADILKGRTLVGHAIQNDLKVLYLSHPKRRIRDTSRYKPFKQLTGGRTPSLKKLSDKLLGVKVQEGEHNSIQDAQATMRLYTMYRKQWEGDILKKKKVRIGAKGKK